MDPGDAAGHAIPGPELERALDVAGGLARFAVEAMRRPRAGAVRFKRDLADMVTGTDEAIERHVRGTLRREFPEHRVEGEEFGVREGTRGAPCWVVDPVDGTTNHAHGIGWCSFSLGLRDGAGPVLGVVADPWRGEVFTAVRGQGARLDGEPIAVTPDAGVGGHVVMTEWAAHAPWRGMGTVLEELSARYCTVRVMGSTALSLAQVAAGRAAGGMIGTYQAVDGMPALLIGLEAGALAFDDDGPVTGEPSGGLLLAAPGAAEELHRIWRGARGARGI
jgi:myo-inositol-1(or 4)-monophosphatase